MYVLYREVSAYDDGNQLLGIFECIESAKQSKAKYIKENTDIDPFKNQSYRNVDLEADVKIETIPFDGIKSNYDEAFLVVALEEGFGQINRKFVCAYESEANAKDYSRQIEEELEWENSWCEVERIEIGQLVSNA